MLAHNFAPLAAARFLGGQRFVLSRPKVIPNARATQFDKREILAQNRRQIAGGAAWPPLLAIIVTPLATGTAQLATAEENQRETKCAPHSEMIPLAPSAAAAANAKPAAAREKSKLAARANPGFAQATRCSPYIPQASPVSLR
jgi:hypothetical protein